MAIRESGVSGLGLTRGRQTSRPSKDISQVETRHDKEVLFLGRLDVECLKERSGRGNLSTPVHQTVNSHCAKEAHCKHDSSLQKRLDTKDDS